MNDVLQKVVALAKRRGFIFQGSEMYGGLNGFYDYGPLGVDLKNNIKKEWWKAVVYAHDNVVGIDSAIITHPRVWEASGHVEAFTDPLVECWNCHLRYREDQLPQLTKEEKEEKNDHSANHHDKTIEMRGENYFSKAVYQCPNCGVLINTHVDQPRQFNLLMKTFLGTVEGKQNQAYLRGETCQGIYLNYKNILDSMWVKIPFGIAQIGKAFRNEITPGNFTFRMREFEQMELEFFVKNDESESQKLFQLLKEERLAWYLRLGMSKDNLRLREHEKDERAHYAKAAVDIEYNSPFGWKEFEGIHHRGDWDLSRHSKYSGQDLTYKDDENETSFIPWILETSAGADRCVLFFLIDAYHEEGEGKKMRTLLKFHPKLAPVKVAIFPLVSNKPELVTKAKAIYNELKTEFVCMWDDNGNVGKRYRRQDEIGTPWCVTVDYQNLEDDTVTVRERDSMIQNRIKSSELYNYFHQELRKG